MGQVLYISKSVINILLYILILFFPASFLFSQPCAPGQYEAVVSGVPTCLPCPQGSYCPDGENSYPCPMGQYSNETGAISCIPCSPGNYASVEGSTSCLNCPVGTYSNTSGAIACTNCAANYYANLEGMINCIECPPGTQSPPGSSYCSPAAVCGDGFCDAYLGENCANCPGDCPCPVGQECIDNVCTYVVDGNVGINNTDPKSALDIHGGLSHRSLNLIISNGDTIHIPDNLSLAVVSGYYQNFGDTIPVVLPNTLADGQRLIIQNKVFVKLGIDVGLNNPVILSPNESTELIHTNDHGWTQLTSSPPLSDSNWKLEGNNFTSPFTHFIGTKDDADLVFKTNDAEKLRIQSNGKIGIATTTPEAVVQINSKATASMPTLSLMDSTLNNIGGPYIQFTNLANTHKLKLKGSLGPASDGSDSYFDFFRNSNTLMTLRGDGNLGVGGVLDPTSRLVVSSSTSNLLSLQNTNPLANGVTNSIHFGGSNYSTGFISTIGQSNSNARMGFFTGYSFTGGASFMLERLSITNNGNIGVNKTSPTQKLDVNGKIKVANDNNAPEAGNIRWNAENNDFEGYNGSEWLSLTKSSNSGWGGNDVILSNEEESSPSNDAYRRMGYSIAMNDTMAVIGSFYNNVYYSGIEKGKVYVYKFDQNNSKWDFYTSIEPVIAGAPSTLFGKSVGISGDHILIGVPSHYVGGNDYAGKVALYKEVGGIYTEVASVVGENQYDHFGMTIDVNDAGHFIASSYANKAYVYFIWGPGGPSYIELTTAINNPSPAFGNFGIYSSITNNYYAYVSALGENKIYIYHYEEQGGIYGYYHVHTINNMSGPIDTYDRNSDDYDYTIVGRPEDDVDGKVNQGKAFIYYRLGNTWTQQDEIISSDGLANDNFGNAVSIYKNYCLIGSKKSEVGYLTNAGKAYVFNRVNTSWQQKTILQPSTAQQDSEFGEAVFINDKYSCVSSILYDASPSILDQGKVFFFKK